MEFTEEQIQIILSSVKTSKKDLEEYHTRTRFGWVKDKIMELDSIIEKLEGDK